MEDLTKTQLVLLTLLVSFVTSIATGIITFSLLEVAPPVVTQTIDRVVEKTVEQVVPVISERPVKETTVVVKEEDQVIEAISKNTGSVVRITNPNTPETPFYAIGVLLTSDGLVVAPVRDILNSSQTYLATFSDKTSHNLRYLGEDSNKNFVFWRIESQGEFSGAPAKIASEALKLGQTVVTIEGQEKNVVSIGRVSSIIYTNPSDPSTQRGVETDIVAKSNAIGAPIVNLSGELVGIRSGSLGSSGGTTYLSPDLFAQSFETYR